MDEVKEHGILFKAEMMQAYFAGRKTQTRRIVKEKDFIVRDDKGKPIATVSAELLSEQNGVAQAQCPYGKVGEIIWSRETIGYPLDGGPVIYRADGGWAEAPDFAKKVLKKGKWTPAIHQKREHARIVTPLLSVRVERLQDISEADAKAEGVEPLGVETGRGNEEVGSYRLAYAHLFDEINGAGRWDKNPFVWALEFPRYEGGILS